MRVLIAISSSGILALGLLAGCGGDGGAEQIDKAAFVRQANQICERVSGGIAAQFTTVTQRESSKPGYDFVGTQTLLVRRALIPGLEEQLEKIRALGIPEEGRKETEALYAAYRRAIDKIKENPKAAATQAIPPYEAIELAGTRFGVSECPVSSVGVN